MGCQSEVYIEDDLVFSICTHDPDTGVLTDAESPPAYRIYKDEDGSAILNGTMDKLDDGNTTGFYTELINCTVGNGFENGKSYTIYISATVDGDTGGICYGFKAVTNLTTILGTPANIDSGGASIAANLKKIADDNDGADYRASRDSLNEIVTRGNLAWVTGAGAAAQNVYTIATLLRTVGDPDAGADTDVDIADGNLFSTGEINSTTLLEVDATFTATVGEDPAYIGMWGNYAGGGSHYMLVKAYNYVDSRFEEIGQIGNSSISSYHQFPLTPQHIHPSTGAMAVKFVHVVTSPGIISHALHIDKLIAATSSASSLPTDVVAALMADTGITEGGTMTYETLMKIQAAWIAGNWRAKSGSSTIKELLDADDGTTVILEMTPSASTPYRSITVKI